MLPDDLLDAPAEFLDVGRRHAPYVARDNPPFNPGAERLQRNTFNERLVRAMILRYGPMPRGPRQPPSDGHSQEMWLSDLAADLNIPIITLYGWLRRGWLKGRRINGQWAIAADRRERQRLRDIRREHPPLNRQH
jgi:hypothetical protein